MEGYRVIPFIAHVKSGKKSTPISKQLEGAIQAQTNQGWQFVEVATVTAKISAGCLGSLLGQSDSYIRYDLIIFKSRT